MGLFDRLFNKKEEKTETPSIQDDSRDSAVMSIIEDGRKRFEYYQAKRDFGQFYDTTRVVVNREPRVVEGRILYDCLVSWYGRDDAVYIMDGAEEMGGRRDTYEHIVAGIDPEKMQADGRYLQMIMTDLLEQKILQTNNNVYVRNLEKEAKENKSMLLVIEIFLYGFIGVITLIGVTNIFNTITSNMELRQKEFAMLKSIGMTKKEFNNMINLETIFYGTKSLIYGIILGLLGTFALYKAFSVKLDLGMYIPVQPIIISIIFVFVLIFIIMKYSVNKINKQNTIETIRKDNI